MTLNNLKAKLRDRRSVVLVTTFLVALSSMGLADSKTEEDPRDNGGFRDIRWVKHAHGDNVQMLRHSLKTYDRWRDRVLEEYRIRFDFNLDEDRDTERALRVRFEDGRLRARMYRGPRLGQRVHGEVEVWRASLRALTVSFEATMLGAGIDAYRWKARFFPNVVCNRPCPGDRAPNESLIRHRL